MKLIRNDSTFGWEEFGAIYTLSTSIIGIGSLSFARSFSMAGPLYTPLALLLMVSINLYASVALAHAMNSSPLSVQTFADLGQHIYGPTGRILVFVSHMGICFAIPIAFLVLGGGIILPRLVESFWPAASPNIMIPLMALTLLPFVISIRTLKEGTVVAFVAVLGTILGDLFAVVDSSRHSPYYENAFVRPQWSNILCVFGSMNLALGGAIVIPSIQRTMTRPENLINVIWVVMISGGMLYLLLGTLGYLQYGCVAPDNLLLSMSDPGFESIALAAFYVHISIGFYVIIYPVFYTLERQLLGFDRKDGCLEDRGNIINEKSIESRFKSMALRSIVVSIEVLIAMLLQGSFDELADFLGSSLSCFANILLPIIFRLKMNRNRMSRLEICWCWICLIVCTIMSVFTSILYLKKIIEKIVQFRPFMSPSNIFSRSPETFNVQYCSAIPRIK